MKTKSKVLISALLAIVLCVSMIAGATFALFTSESSVNVAVTSGKVDVNATVDKNSVMTVQKDSEYVKGLENVYAGTVSVEGNSVVLNGIAAGDGVKFAVKVVNNSTLTVKYRTRIEVVGVGADQLAINVDGQQIKAGRTTLWQTLTTKGSLADVNIEVRLPALEGSQSQDIDCSINYVVEAIQGNAETTNPADVALPAGYEDYTAAGDGTAIGQALVGESDKIYVVENTTFNNTYWELHPCDIEAIMSDDAALTKYIEDYKTVANVSTSVETLKSRIQKKGFEKTFSDLSGIIPFSGTKTIDLGGNSLTFTQYTGLIINEGSNVTIKNGTLNVSSSAQNAIDVGVGATLTLENVVFDMPSGCTMVTEGDVYMKDCTVTGCDCDPVLSVQDGAKVVIDHCNVSNTGADSLNAIYMRAGTVEIINGSVISCETPRYQGDNVCIWNQSGTLVVKDSTLTSNHPHVVKVYDSEGNVVE